MVNEKIVPLIKNENIKSWVTALAEGGCTSAQFTDLIIEHRELLVGDWLRRGDLGFIFAARGLGKTWFSMNLARGIAERKNVGPWSTHHQAKVLYLDGEMPPDDIKERDSLLGDPLDDLTYINHEILFQRTGRSMNLADMDFQQAVLDFCLDQRFKVLFADNLSTLSFGIDENKSLDWEIILPWLLNLRRNHVTVIFIHHAGRNNEMRGSSKREDPAFWVIRLDPPFKEASVGGANFITRFTKWRNSSQKPLPYQWNYQAINDGKELSIEFSECSNLSLFRHWIESGLDTCTDIASEMDVTKGYVSRMAKSAEAAGWLGIKNRRYFIKEKT
jgi:hypothetical protein